MSTAEIAKECKADALEIIEQTKQVRAEIRKARPNSSEESTALGALEALEMMLAAAPDEIP
jgi:hypothetical protein